jgi:hypothetical protein
MLVAAGCASSPPLPPEKTEDTLELEGPAIIGFYPGATQAKIDDAKSGVAEGVAHLRAAMDDVVECLASGGIEAKAHLAETDWIHVRDGKKVFPLYPPLEGMVGAYLLRPGIPPRFVDAVEGPSTLVQSLPIAASQYFSAPACAGKAKKGSP